MTTYRAHTIMAPIERIGNTVFITPRTITEREHLCRIEVGDVLTVLDPKARPEDVIPHWRIVSKVELQRRIVVVIVDSD